MGLVDNTGADAVRYQPSDADFALNVLRSLKIEFAEYAFVDFGSGKGRVLLVASELPFQQVVGVELSEDLHRIALENIKKHPAGQRRCGELIPLNISATEYVPAAIPTVAYFYNPFGPTTLDRVVEKLERAHSVGSPPHWVVYVDPRHVDVFWRRQLWKVVRLTDWLCVLEYPSRK